MGCVYIHVSTKFLRSCSEVEELFDKIGRGTLEFPSVGDHLALDPRGLSSEF